MCNRPKGKQPTAKGCSKHCRAKRAASGLLLSLLLVVILQPSFFCNIFVLFAKAGATLAVK